jgi:hypothetical protein
VSLYFGQEMQNQEKIEEFRFRFEGCIILGK